MKDVFCFCLDMPACMSFFFLLLSGSTPISSPSFSMSNSFIFSRYSLSLSLSSGICTAMTLLGFAWRSSLGFGSINRNLSAGSAQTITQLSLQAQEQSETNSLNIDSDLMWCRLVSRGTACSTLLQSDAAIALICCLWICELWFKHTLFKAFRFESIYFIEHAYCSREDYSSSIETKTLRRLICRLWCQFAQCSMASNFFNGCYLRIIWTLLCCLDAANGYFYWRYQHEMLPLRNM